MSLLTMVTQVCRRIGIVAPNAVVSSADPQIIQLLALANEEGEELANRYPWQAMRQQATFTTVATESQGTMTALTGADFKYIVNETFYNRSLRRPVFGPLSDSDWQNLKAMQINGPWNQFRIRGNEMLFIPVPAAGQDCYFEWQSKNWCGDSTGVTTRSAWGADDDIGILDETIMLHGLIWRWKSVKGFDYAEDMAKYERLVDDATARDGGKPILNGSANRFDVYPGVLVPSGSWAP